MKRILIPVAVVAVAAVVFFGLNLGAGGEDPSEITMAFDDYTALSDFQEKYEVSVSEVSGAIALIQIGGADYIHAADTGTGKILCEDGKTFEVSVKKAQLDVFLITGQSNATYSSSTADPTGLIIPLGTAYYYWTPTRPVSNHNYSLSENSIHPMTDPATGSVKIGGLDGALAHELSIKNYKSKILVVNASIGGKAVATFLPGQPTYLYIQEILEDALDKIDVRFDYTVKDYIWLQGEADRYTSITQYQAHFLTFHGAASGTGPVRLLPDHAFSLAYIVKTREFNSPNASAAQIALAEENETIILASIRTDTFSDESGTLKGDNLHYTQLGHGMIAKDLALKITEMNR